MRTILACAALAALTACGSQEPEPAPQPTETVAAPLPEPEPSLPAPDEEVFAAAFAEACPDAQKVSTSICRSQGFGEEGFVCEYGLGDDEYRRNTVDLAPGDGKWVVAEPEKACAA